MIRGLHPFRFQTGAHDRSAGFTLVELTLSIAMLVTLTMVLFGFLRTGMGLYRAGEGRRDVYERAQILLDQVVRDFDGIAATRRQPGVPARITLLGDRDANGRPRLRFVRSLGDEMVDPVLRGAGTRPGATGYVDLVGDVDESRYGLLLPPGGLMEVAYLSTTRREDSSVWLYRGVRSPIGGPGSLFAEGAMPFENQAPSETLRPLTSGVLHFGLRYRGRDKAGAAKWMETWDSTRGRLPAFDLHLGPESLLDSSDDVFPSAIEVTMVLEEPGKGRTFLARDLSEVGSSLTVNSTSLMDLSGDPGWVRIDDEWMQVTVANSRTFKVIERGGRGSVVASHDRRAPVLAGSRFMRTIPVPVGLEVLDDAQ